MVKIKSLILIALLSIVTTIYSQVQPKKEWWLEEPYRLIQTNLREIDAIDFDIEVYVKSVIDIGANTVLINVGGIVANYYTDLEFHYQNPSLKINLIDELIERLHKEGIRVIGRFDFSKLNENYAVKKPEWQYKSVKGDMVNYNGQVHMCVNGYYQQEYALKILEEALRKFPLDGVFFNMSGYQVRDYSHNYIGICQSDACKHRFEKWSGGLKLPTIESKDDPEFRKYQQFKEETSSQLYIEKCELIKSFGDHIAIINYNPHGTDFYRSESHSHGSLYSKLIPWEYTASDKVKRILGTYQRKQASNAAVHFYGYPARHTSDSRWVIQRRLVDNIMHGAGLDFYCIGRLDNLEDSRSLQNVKDVYQFHKKNENYLHHTISKNRVLVLNAKINKWHGSDENKGVFEILSENHILFDVMEHTYLDRDDLPRKINSYDLIILPEVISLSDAQCKILDKYVKNGGKILASGITSTMDEHRNPLNKIRLKSLGVKADYKLFEKEQGTYFRIFDKDKGKLGKDTFKDLDLVYAWEKGMLCEPVDSATGYLGYIPPAMIGPPEKCYYKEVTEIPGLIHNKFGNGETAFIPFRLGTLYHHKRHRGHADIFMAAITKLLSYKQNMKTNASPLIEINNRVDVSGKFEWFGLLNHSGQLGGGFFEPIPIHNTKLNFKPNKKVKTIKSLVSDEELSFETNSEGQIELEIPVLEYYDFILVEYF